MRAKLFELLATVCICSAASVNTAGVTANTAEVTGSMQSIYADAVNTAKIISEVDGNEERERIGDYWLSENVYELTCDCEAYFDDGKTLTRLTQSNVDALCPNNEVYQIYAVGDYYVVIIDTESVG